MDNSKPAVKVWDLPLRLFHWALVIAVAVAFLSSEENSALNQWHVLSGWIVAILIIFRLVWGFVGGEHSRFSDFVRPSRIGDHLRGLFSAHSQPSLGHNPLGAISVIILLALAAATVWTGASGMEVHEIVGWTLLAMIAVHIAAVIIMSLVERENLVRAMIRGDKPARRHPGARSARPPSAVALIVALAVLAGTAYAILQYDPQAFTLRSAEAFEHRGDAHDSAAEVNDRSDERD